MATYEKCVWCKGEGAFLIDCPVVPVDGMPVRECPVCGGEGKVEIGCRGCMGHGETRVPGPKEQVMDERISKLTAGVAQPGSLTAFRFTHEPSCPVESAEDDPEACKCIPAMEYMRPGMMN